MVMYHLNYEYQSTKPVEITLEELLHIELYIMAEK